MLTREEEKKLRNEIREAEESKRKAIAETKKANERTKKAKEEARKAGLSDRKPSRFEIASFVLASPFLSVPRTVEEIDREALRVAVSNGLKSNEAETRTVRKAVLGVLFANETLRVSDGKIYRTGTEAKKTA